MIHVCNFDFGDVLTDEREGSQRRLTAVHLSVSVTTTVLSRIFNPFTIPNLLQKMKATVNG